MTRSRVWLFRLIMLCLPLAFFILLELILRLSNYGNSYPLFIDTPDSPNYQLARPDIIKRYFPENSPIPSVTMEASLFLKQKPDNGLRIFVQGGSTAAGFPYGLGASIAGMLDQRLKQTFPDKHVEVINTAMSAVNSYTLLDFVDEIIAQQPDAVLIYAGHNEYLGIMGVGSNFSSSNSHTANLLFLSLKELRLYQLLQNIIYQWRSDSATPVADETGRRTFMSKVAREKNIVIDSELYHAGVEQFRSNLKHILEKYQRAGIPVYLSTLASNLKDQLPFVSAEIPASAKQQLNTVMDRVISKRVSDTAVEQIVAGLLQNPLYSDSADGQFMMGKIYEQSGLLKQGKQHFIQAKELDQLRFRAPEVFNDIIRSAAQSDQVYLVDYQTNLANKSPGTVIGKEFMLEHLHPNLQGYFVLADSFYHALMKHSLSQLQGNYVSTNTAWTYRPVLPAEEYYAFAQIIHLKSDYPFTDQPTEVVLPKPSDWQQQIGYRRFNKEIDWITMVSDSYRGYVEERDMSMIMKSAQIIADAIPHNDKANYEFGRLLVQAGRTAEARLYFKRAVLEQPQNELYQKAYQAVAD